MSAAIITQYAAKLLLSFVKNCIIQDAMLWAIPFREPFGAPDDNIFDPVVSAHGSFVKCLLNLHTFFRGAKGIVLSVERRAVFHIEWG